jgi:hypothetical protein
MTPHASGIHHCHLCCSSASFTADEARESYRNWVIWHHVGLPCLAGEGARGERSQPHHPRPLFLQSLPRSPCWDLLDEGNKS